MSAWSALGDAWEHRHRPALRALADRFEVRAVWTRWAAEQLAAAEFGVDTVDGFRALAAREDIDAILMLAPQWYGSLPVLAACDTGKAVYFGGGQQLEPDLAETIRQRVEQAGVAFMAEFLRRQSPATLRLKELIVTRLGPPRLLFCHNRSAIPEKVNHASRPHRTILRETRRAGRLVPLCGGIQSPAMLPALRTRPARPRRRTTR